MSPQDLVLELDADIVSIAAGVAKTYPSVVDKDDVIQELRLYALEQAKWLDGYEPKVRRSILRREAHKYCTKERTAATWFSDQYHYTKDQVRDLVEEHVLGDGEPGSTVETVTVLHRHSEENSVKGVYTTEDRVDQFGDLPERLDIGHALMRLDPGARARIYEYIGTDPRPDRRSPARQAYDHAIDKLTIIINGNR